MKRLWRVGLCVLVPATMLSGCGSAGSVGIAGAHPAAAGIDGVFADIDPAGPGCAVGVVAGGELVYGAGYGLANLDYGIPITPRSNFYLGSVSKQFTAAAIAHAARAGHLSLEDRVQRWVPELPEYDRPITIRHLVHHTSGLRDYLTLTSLAGRTLENVYSAGEVLSLIAAQRAPNFPAGDEFLYSNSGYFLLAVIIERATGQSLRRYLETELLHPLGMTRTRVYDHRHEIIPDRVVAYRREGDRWLMSHLWNFDQVGSGGIYSSVEELARWDRNHYTEEAGGSGFTDAMLERGVLNGGDTIPYAFGLVHGSYRGLATVAHGGALAGFRSHLVRFPEERTTVAVLCSLPDADAGARASRVADVVLANRLAPAPAPAPVAAARPEESTAPAGPVATVAAADLDAFVGHWRASMGAEVRIQREGDHLFFVQGPSRAPIAVLSDSVLRVEAVDLQMTFSGRVEGLYTFMDVAQRGRAFTARRFDPASRDYSAVVGTYYSQELDATYHLYEEAGRLMVEMPTGRQAEALPADGDRLRTPAGLLQLERADGRVVGFTMDAGRARGIRFVRRGDR